MNGGRKTYRKVKKSSKVQGRVDRKMSKQTGRTMKKGGKTVAKGEKQQSKSIRRQSAGVSKGGTPKTKPRTKMSDAQVKIKSGKAAQSNPTPKKKVQKKAYSTTKNINYGAPGQKKYLTKSGRQTNRRGGRPRT